MTRDEFNALLAPLAEALSTIDINDPATATAAVEKACPFDGETVTALREAAIAEIDSEWLLPKEAGGIRFGRVVRDLSEFSVDAVLMSSPGPLHRHPNGEIDLCFATDSDPQFDGKPEGWVVYEPGSQHIPTVTGGEMLILYFLPGGAIEFL